MRIFFITDNKLWFEKINKWRIDREEEIEVFCSPKGEFLFSKEILEGQISSIDLKSQYQALIEKYNIGFSCHSKQIFPEPLINEVKCINIHPGLNPYNRGWFPQVFSIINGYPVGATIHIMNKEIDNGSIIAQQEVKIKEDDTSKEVYERIVDAEFRLFDLFIEDILLEKYTCIEPKSEGNYNSISDFRDMCKINLNKNVTFKEAINYFRAMTFEGHDNAFFLDEDGKKVYISISMKSESNKN